MNEQEQDHKLAQAYAVILLLVSAPSEDVEIGDEDTERALAYFASEEYDEDFLPWPRPPVDPKVAAYDAARLALAAFEAGNMTEQELAHALKSAGAVIGGHDEAA